MADCAAIKARLDSAIAARDRLVAGAQVVVIVDGARSRVEYTPAQMPMLTVEIQRLTAEYQLCINPGKPNVLTRPVQFIF